MRPVNRDDDYNLQTLLDFHDWTYHYDNGYMVKFKAWVTKPSKHIPHGIRYSLTLHNEYGERIVGYDNAHNCLPQVRKYKARKVTWDHIHKRNRAYPYEFDSASQLIEDFWKTAEEYLQGRKR